MFCFCRIPVALESRRSSRWGGRGGCAPPTPSPWIHSCLWTIRHSHISHNAPYLPSKILHLFFISPGYYSRPKRNWKQTVCKILGGKEGALWEMWKWRVENMVLGRSRIHLSQFNTYVEVRLLCLMCLVFSSLCPITYISCDLENQRKISHGEPRA